ALAFRITCVRFDPTGRRLAAAATDGTVTLWDPDSGKELLRLRHRHDPRALAFGPGGKYLLTGTGPYPESFGDTPGEVKLGDTATGKEVRAFRGQTQSVHGVAFSPEGGKVAAATWTTIYVWDVETGKLLFKLPGGHRRVAFSPDGKRLATLSPPVIKFWDADTGQEIVPTITRPRGTGFLAFSPDGKRLATAGRGAGVILWDV